MTQNGDMIEGFRYVGENRHEYARAWKSKTGSKVIGWLCTYSPIEIIKAAGMLPVRILGSHEVDRIADEYFGGLPCPYCIDCLCQGLRGRYEYLDGIVHARSCDAIEQAFHNWGTFLPINFSHYIFMPGHVQSPRALTLLTKEYSDFKEALEKLGGKSISNEDLNGAIEAYNTNRRLLKQVFEFRKQDNPSITGEEALEIVIAGQLMDVEEHNELLKQLIEQLPNRKLERETGVRLMLVGSENDDVSFFRFLESLGATCVIEESCCSTKYFWDEVVPQEDPLEALASRYINRWRCPTFDWDARTRPERILKLAQDYNIQGAILYMQKFCSPHGYDIPVIKGMFDSHNIPVLILEFDVTIPTGQFQTRIEAFLEELTLELIV